MPRGKNVIRETVLLDFQDHMAPYSAYDRVRALFVADGVVGGPLAAIQQLQDLPDPTLAEHLFYSSPTQVVVRPPGG